MGYPLNDEPYQEGDLYWRLVLGLAVPLNVIYTLGLKFIFPYETIKFNIRRNNNDEALIMIRKIYIEDEQLVLSFLKK